MTNEEQEICEVETVEGVKQVLSTVPGLALLDAKEDEGSIYVLYQLGGCRVELTLPKQFVGGFSCQQHIKYGMDAETLIRVSTALERELAMVSGRNRN